MTFGTRLRLAREWRGYEQKDMAEVLGVTRQTVSNYERGATPMSKLAINAWAAHCRIDVEWLKTGIEPTTSPDGGGGLDPQGSPRKITFWLPAHESNVRHLPNHRRHLRWTPDRQAA